MIRIRFKKKMKGAATVVLDNENRMLLLKRSMKSRWMPGKWGLPGGKIEAGETSKFAAARETKEETGLVVTGLKLLPSFGSKGADIYRAASYTGEVVIDFEHDAYAWLSREEIDKYETTPEIVELFDWILENEYE